MNKQLLYSAIFSSIMLPVAAFAADADISTIVSVPAAPLTEAIVAPNENAVSVKTEVRVDKLTATAERLTSERITALTKAQTKINANKHLTAEQKTKLVAELQVSIVAMQQIQTTVKAGDMNADALKKQIAAIYADHRIFAVVIPRVHVEATFYTQTNHSTRLGEAFAKLQAHIDAAKTRGLDVSVWQTKLDAAKTKNAELATKISAAFSLASAIKPADYPEASKKAFTDARTSVKAHNQTFHEIDSMIKAGVRDFGDHRKMFKKHVDGSYNAAIKASNDAYQADMRANVQLKDKAARKDAMKSAQEKMKSAKAAARAAHKAEMGTLKVQK